MDVMAIYCDRHMEKMA